VEATRLIRSLLLAVDVNKAMFVVRTKADSRIVGLGMIGTEVVMPTRADALTEDGPRELIGPWRLTGMSNWDTMATGQGGVRS
jgi:hypothetical protein